MFLADERAEHEFFVQCNALSPFVYCGYGDAEMLTDIGDGRSPLEIRGQNGKDKQQAIPAVWNDDVREERVRTPAGCATETVRADQRNGYLPILKGHEIPAIISMFGQFPFRAAFGARFLQMAEFICCPLKFLPLSQFSKICLAKCFE